MLAAGVIYMTNRILNKNQISWNSELETVTGYSHYQVKDCAKYLLTVLKESNKVKHKAINRKF